MTVKFVGSAHEIVGIQQDDVYEMVETTAYFEAYRHVLKALQETEQGDLPFEVKKLKFDLPGTHLHNSSVPSYLEEAAIGECAQV